MLSRSLILALPAFALLLGCSSTGGSNQPSAPMAAEVPPPLPPAPAPFPINDAPAGLDGYYAGMLRLARAAWPSCRPVDIPASATVANGQVAIALGGYGLGEGIIGGDGGANVTGSDFVGDVRFRCDRLGGLVQHTTCPYTVHLERLATGR